MKKHLKLKQNKKGIVGYDFILALNTLIFAIILSVYFVFYNVDRYRENVDNYMTEYLVAGKNKIFVSYVSDINKLNYICKTMKFFEYRIEGFYIPSVDEEYKPNCIVIYRKPKYIKVFTNCTDIFSATLSLKIYGVGSIKVDNTTLESNDNVTVLENDLYYRVDISLYRDAGDYDQVVIHLKNYKEGLVLVSSNIDRISIGNLDVCHRCGPVFYKFEKVKAIVNSFNSKYIMDIKIKK